MRITKRQLKRIIKEENAGLVREMKADGTISDDEDGQRDDLLTEVEMTMRDLIQDISMQARTIGGEYRSPGIKAECKKLMLQIIGEMR